MSDSATAETSKAANKICRDMHIKRHTSEPRKQNQNAVERYVQEAKRGVVTLLDRVGAPDKVGSMLRPSGASCTTSPPTPSWDG